MIRHLRAAAHALAAALVLASCLASIADPASAADRVLLRIEGTNAADNARLLDLGFEIAAARPGEWTDLIVSTDDVARIRALGYPVLSSDPLPLLIPPLYTTYVEMVAALQQLAAAYPSIARLEDIGDAMGKVYNDPNNYPAFDVWALKISDNVGVDESEPAILYTGVHHAREPVTLEICMGIANHLLSNYGGNPAVTRYVNDHETWIVPLVNPDGHWIVTDVDWTSWRKNIRDNDGDGGITPPYWNVYPDGVDPNRNYSWQWGGQGSSGDPNSQTYRGPSAFSESENQAIRDLTLRENFAMTMDYHSYGELVLFPYGYDNTSTAPDHSLLQSIAVAVRDAIGGNYIAQQSNQLYPAAGASLDWHYGAQNAMAMLLEVGTQFIPPESQIGPIVTANIRGAMVLQDRIDGAGVRGIVRIEGVPGQASVTLVGVDSPPMNTPRRSHPMTGDYYRLTAPGTWTLRFEAEGYAAQEHQVVVPQNAFVTLDVSFGIAAEVADAATARGLSFAVGPNPVRESAVLRYTLPAGTESASFALHDLEGRRVLERSLRGSSGTLVWEANGAHGTRLSAGVYLARVRAGVDEAVRRIVIVP